MEDLALAIGDVGRFPAGRGDVRGPSRFWLGRGPRDGGSIPTGARIGSLLTSQQAGIMLPDGTGAARVSWIFDPPQKSSE